jgi:hypothetical protein
MKPSVILGLFQVGVVVITPGAELVLSHEDIMRGLQRHVCGDWGELDLEDRSRNDEALIEDYRLFSRYVTEENIVFYIITEGDRSYTTILLPQDY